MVDVLVLLYEHIFTHMYNVCKNNMREERREKIEDRRKKTKQKNLIIKTDTLVWNTRID